MKAFLHENRLLLWGALAFAIAALLTNAVVRALHVHP